MESEVRISLTGSVKGYETLTHIQKLIQTWSGNSYRPVPSAILFVCGIQHETREREIC